MVVVLHTKTGDFRIYRFDNGEFKRNEYKIKNVYVI